MDSDDQEVTAFSSGWDEEAEGLLDLPFAVARTQLTLFEQWMRGSLVLGASLMQGRYPDRVFEDAAPAPLPVEAPAAPVSQEAEATNAAPEEPSALPERDKATVIIPPVDDWERAAEMVAAAMAEVADHADLRAD